MLRVASPIPTEVVLQRDEYFLSSEADYVAPLSVMISFLVKVIVNELIIYTFYLVINPSSW